MAVGGGGQHLPLGLIKILVCKHSCDCFSSQNLIMQHLSTLKCLHLKFLWMWRVLINMNNSFSSWTLTTGMNMAEDRGWALRVLEHLFLLPKGLYLPIWVLRTLYSSVHQRPPTGETAFTITYLPLKRSLRSARSQQVPLKADFKPWGALQWFK